VTPMFRACYASGGPYDGVMPDAAPASHDWPGQRLGLPESGPRSIARLGRRIIAIVVDWATASLVGYVFFEGEAFAILAAFAVLQYVFIVTASGSIGHLLLGMRVVPLRPQWIGVWRPAVRTLLLCLVIPAVIYNSDQRGLHDQFAGTVLVRR
jgi:uncharacterized RDD family membrane protein YckC